MNNTDHASNEETFAEALRLPSPETRAAYLKAAVVCNEPRRRHFCVIHPNRL